MLEMDRRRQLARESHPCVVVHNTKTMEELELYSLTTEEAVCLAANPEARGGQDSTVDMPAGWSITVAGMLHGCAYGAQSVTWGDWCALYDQSLEPRNGFGPAPGEETYIDVSTCYLTDAECNILNMASAHEAVGERAPLIAYRKSVIDAWSGEGDHYGWFVYVPDDEIVREVLPMLPAGMLRHIMGVAHAEGHTLVVFDRDGGVRSSFNGMHDAFTGRDMLKQEG